ncbi:hypothetical protein [Pseudonocardia sp. TRM90224]|uniref:hypothetical protein n=1 Tax=Pseudonocardia sp. TRM90224 TaxID=2812678 RepID=UPI001E3A0C14|nr:hypothetical protein [Pseudonocardia sp. TRM90224]
MSEPVPRTGYEDFPAHPLHDVPFEVLHAARTAVQRAAEWKHVDPELAEPLADAVVMACLPAMRKWLSP